MSVSVNACTFGNNKTQLYYDDYDDDDDGERLTIEWDEQ